MRKRCCWLFVSWRALLAQSELSMLTGGPSLLRRMSASAETEARVLIVGTGLTGSLTCYHLRSLLKKEVHIDMTDMARAHTHRAHTHTHHEHTHTQRL